MRGLSAIWGCPLLTQDRLYVGKVAGVRSSVYSWVFKSCVLGLRRSLAR